MKANLARDSVIFWNRHWGHDTRVMVGWDSHQIPGRTVGSAWIHDDGRAVVDIVRTDNNQPLGMVYLSAIGAIKGKGK
jgi:hypothetical protein